eukprot:TRINITY_DN2525_c1_g1_i1.p1 TRINITY_DN2525_c1_g1~~TRINITY_DN2525_c1_g1_i1.p1  ORF type:complete len:503 (+),score=92.75 TRINITY_DN2525_c1_g1_i1:29-1510(+)
MGVDKSYRPSLNLTSSSSFLDLFPLDIKYDIIYRLNWPSFISLISTSKGVRKTGIKLRIHKEQQTWYAKSITTIAVSMISQMETLRYLNFGNCVLSTPRKLPNFIKTVTWASIWRSEWLTVLPNSIEKMSGGRFECDDHEKLNFPSSLKELKLWNSPAIFQYLPDTIERLSFLNSVTLLSLKGLPQSIRHLDIRSATAISEQFYRYLPNQLTSLNISGIHLSSDEWMCHLPPALAQIKMSGLSDEIGCFPCTWLTDRGISLLPPSITYLSARYCVKLTQDCLYHLPTNLQKLDFSCNVNIEWEHGKDIPWPPHLQHIILKNDTKFIIPNEPMKFAGMSSLPQTLKVLKMSDSPGEVRDEVFLNLPTSLEKLVLLNFSSLTDETVRHLSTLTNLTNLNFTNELITADSAQYLPSSLKVMSYSPFHLTIESVVRLSKLTKLKVDPISMNREELLAFFSIPEIDLRKEYIFGLGKRKKGNNFQQFIQQIIEKSSLI